MSGALIERVRLSAYLILAAVLGSFVWIMDASWGWSSGGWLTIRFGFHDSIASLVVHGVAGAFTFGVLLNLGPRIGKYTVDGAARTFRGHNTHLTLMGLMLIFTGFYGFYAACLVIQSTAFPGWLNIYLSPTTLGAIAFVITFGFAAGSPAAGSPARAILSGPCQAVSRRDLRVRGADVYHPRSRTCSRSRAACSPSTQGGTSRRSSESTTRSVRSQCTASAASRRFLVGIFAGGYPTGINNVESSIGGQLMGMLAFLPLAFLPGYLAGSSRG